MKTRVALFFGICATIATIGACALLGNPIAEKVADVVDDYCKEPQAARELYRDTINEHLQSEGHRIEVSCSGDTLD